MAQLVLTTTLSDANLPPGVTLQNVIDAYLEDHPMPTNDDGTTIALNPATGAPWTTRQWAEDDHKDLIAMRVMRTCRKRAAAAAVIPTQGQIFV